MRVGTLEIQMMASMARLSKDMNDAQRIVGGAMGNIEKSVASAKRAMQTLGVGLPITAMVDQVRRMTDQYTKLDAQLRLSTRSQAEYARGMADIRRISTVAQSDLSSTSMLYTRLMNVMQGTGVEQSKLATVTETVSFGLKAYGATAQEASSAALQLSQAMGANRLGGEEFRAVMEAMPNVMKVLADSMGVPLGSLRQLSIEGKITADEMVKAFGNPAVAAQFKAMAEGAQTITGAWIVARNELMLLVGEFMKSSGATGGMIAGFNALGQTFKLMVEYMGQLVSLATIMAVLYAGRYVAGLIQARLAQMALNAAIAESALAKVAEAEATAFAAKANLAGAAAAARAGGSMALASAAAKEYTVASAALATAQETAAAATLSTWGKLKAFAVNNALGLLGLALWGAYTLADHLGWVDALFNRASKAVADLKTLAGENAVFAQAMAQADQKAAQRSEDAARKRIAADLGIKVSAQATTAELIVATDAAIKDMQGAVTVRGAQFREDLQRLKDLRIALGQPLKDAPTAKVAAQVDHDTAFITQQFQELQAQYDKHKISQAEYAAGITKMYQDLLPKNEKAAAVAREEAKAQKELRAMREASAKYNQDNIDSINSETDALLKKIEQERFDTEAIGKTKEQLALLQAVRYDNVTVLQEQKLASLEANFASEAEIAAVKDQIKARKELKGVWKAQATAQAADAQRKAWKEVWDSVDKTAHDTFVSILNGGKDTATRLKEAFKNGFFDWLYSMTVKKWIINISGVASGAGVSGAAMAAGGGGSGGGMLDPTSMLTSFGGMVDWAGIIGGSMGTFGTGIASAMSTGVVSGFMNGISAIGAGQTATGLGMMLPGAGIALAALGAFGAFGGGGGTPGTNVGNVNRQYDAQGNLLTNTISSVAGAGTQQSMIESTTQSMQDAYLNAAKALGIGTVGTTFFRSEHLGKNSAAPQFALGGGVTGSGLYNSGWTAKSDTEVQLAASRAVFTALQGSQLPQYLAKMFNGLTAGTMSQRDIDNTIAFATGVKRMRESLLETRTPLEILQQQVNDASIALMTTATTFKTDFVAAIDAGINQQTFAQWIALGQAMDQLAQSQTQASQAMVNAWQSITDAIFAEVARIRGLTATPGGTSAQFATLTAMARAGDENAAKLLPGVARAMLDVAALSTSNAVDLARIRGRTAASLEVTGTTLASKYGLAIPAYASGGMHAGGLRLVGENGPELEYTGPSAITNSTNTRTLLNNDEVVAELKTLRAELVSIKSSNYRMLLIEDKWDNDGMPAVRA